MSAIARLEAEWKESCPTCKTALAFPGLGWERIWCDGCQTTVAESYEGRIRSFDNQGGEHRAD